MAGPSAAGQTPITKADVQGVMKSPQGYLEVPMRVYWKHYLIEGSVV